MRAPFLKKIQELRCLLCLEREVWTILNNIEKMPSAGYRDKKKEIIAKLNYDLPVLRARIGISQAELAERIGVSRQTYNSLETGKKEMSWTTCLALIAIFQNNEETKRMLSNIDGLKDELLAISES